MKSVYSLLTLILLLGLGSELQAKSNDGDLSVKLIYAEGKIFYNQTLVVWSTESELLSCEFFIEASLDGQNWVIRGRQHGKGKPDQMAEYIFADTRDDRMKYYRLRELDPRGTQVLSNFEPENYSISVNLEEFKIQNERKIVLEYSVDKDQELMVRIFNKIGQQVVTTLMPFKEAGEYIYQLDVSQLAPGNYLLVVTQVLLDKSVAEQQFTLK
jgi:hypothetical protein